jgi:hypothetical protein
VFSTPEVTFTMRNAELDGRAHPGTGLVFWLLSKVSNHPALVSGSGRVGNRVRTDDLLINNWPLFSV